MRSISIWLSGAAFRWPRSTSRFAKPRRSSASSFSVNDPANDRASKRRPVYRFSFLIWRSIPVSGRESVCRLSFHAHRYRIVRYRIVRLEMCTSFTGESEMKIKRKGSAAWQGGLKDGKGTISTESGALECLSLRLRRPLRRSARQQSRRADRGRPRQLGVRPEVGFVMVASICIRVVLPAPFGPSSPSTPPFNSSVKSRTP